MKQFIICILLLVSTATSFSQQPDPSAHPLTLADYLQKSKSQKITSFILLGIGATMFAIAAPGTVSFGTLGTLVTIGGLSTLSSIPLFIASGRNKRKARSLSAHLDLQKRFPVGHNFAIGGHYPVMALKIDL